MEGGDTMKKLISIIVSILFVLSVTGLCFAADPAVKAAEPEKKVEKKAADEKKAPVADEKKVEKKVEKKAKKAKKVKEEKKAEEAAPAAVPAK
jgi:outer membrane biosynthesis protein TonB